MDGVIQNETEPFLPLSFLVLYVEPSVHGRMPFLNDALRTISSFLSDSLFLG